MNTAIWWIRRDLRIRDNLALEMALNSADEVIPLFILDSNLLGGSRSSVARNKFLYNGMMELDIQLRKLGSKLFIRQGTTEKVFTEIFQEIAYSQIFAEEDYSPYSKKTR